MVCSPHQYTLQKIAMPAYMPSVAYLTQNNYLQKPVYQFRQQQELYTTNLTKTRKQFGYQTQSVPQYKIQYQNNENNEISRNKIPNVQFAPSVSTFVKLEQPDAISTQPLASTGQDYGLPIYRASGIVETKPQQKMKRDDLMQRIQLELAAMNEEKLPEDHLCAA